MKNIDTRNLEKRLAGLRKNEIPTATRNTINDLMVDVTRRLQKEAFSVFDRPVPSVIRSIRVRQRATKQKLVGAVGVGAARGKGETTENEDAMKALAPHIPGFKSSRESKGLEGALRYTKILKEDEYLVPSRTMRLNKYGNITGGAASKMVSDLGAYRGVSGLDFTTIERINKAGKSNVKYIWGTVQKKGGGTVTGIWLKSKFGKGGGAALQMLVVKGAPTYAKRFRFKQVATSWAAKRAKHHADLAIENSIRRRNT